MSALLEDAKTALRITTDAYDGEIELLIQAAKQDLGIAGVVVPVALDAIAARAVITFVKLNFGEPDNYDRLKASYDEQKAQLSMASGYTLWTDQM